MSYRIEQHPDGWHVLRRGKELGVFATEQEAETEAQRLLEGLRERPVLVPGFLLAARNLRACRECGVAYSVRAGRGLCRGCWDDPAIRERHPPLAPFGGRAAFELKMGRKR